MEKPKVRFSQTLLSSNQKETTNTNSKGKVKIKSIIPINYPIKIIKNGKRILVNNKDKTNKSSELDMHKCLETDKENSNTDIQILNSKPVHTSHCLSETLSTPSSSRISMDENLSENEYNDHRGDNNFILQDCINKLNRITIEDNSINNSYKLKDFEVQICDSNKNASSKHSNTEATQTNIPCITCEDSDQDSDIEVIKIIKPTNSRIHQPAKKNINHKEFVINSKINHINVIKQNKCKREQKVNKENCSKITLSKKLENRLPVSKTCKILKNATNEADKVSKTVIIKRNPKISKKENLVPCSKFRDPLTKNKPEAIHSKTTVNKSTVLDVIGSQSNISVERAIIHNKCDHNTDCNLKETNEKNNIIYKDLLSRPEYNSTINVIKNLKEIEKQELITHLEHLPSIYKNLIYGKVSTALDFAPYESVYTDLINLSVDNEKLPSRIRRSKDPEPRNKDIVPKLSDFYNPKCTEQYFTIVNPPTLTPLSMNTLSSFTISNKIYSWKILRDNFE